MAKKKIKNAKSLEKVAGGMINIDTGSTREFRNGLYRAMSNAQPVKRRRNPK